MRQKIGPFDDFALHRGALSRLGDVRRKRGKSEARCLAAACVEIRDQGAEAIQGHEPGLFDVHRCGYIITISVKADGAGTVLDFYEFSL